VDIAAHVSAVQVALADLVTDDEASHSAGQRLSNALGPALQLQVLDLLGEVALEVSQQIPDGHVDLQLAGRDAVLVYRADLPAPTPSADEGSDTARLTLRMPDSLKSAVEAAAAAQNISTNAWLIAAARRHLAPAPSAAGNPVSSNRRISGFVQN
jgi:hypothetical protein